MTDLVLPQSYLDQPRWWHGGADWLAALPDAVAAQCRRWDLTIDGAPRHGSNALVVPVLRDEEPLMLRMFPPEERTAVEIAALRFWDGRGTARLVAADAQVAAMLLERVVPGTPASDLTLSECMPVMGEIMRRLAVLPPPDAPRTADIVRGRELAQQWERLDEPFSKALLRAGEDAAANLTTSREDLAVNGDLHADQILRATREPWLAVDLLLYRGDIEYDLARIIWSRIDEMPTDAAINDHIRTVVDAARLDPVRARDWVIYRTVDYWLWGLGVGLTEDPVRCERLLGAIRA